MLSWPFLSILLLYWQMFSIRTRREREEETKQKRITRWKSLSFYSSSSSSSFPAMGLIQREKSSIPVPKICHISCKHISNSFECWKFLQFFLCFYRGAHDCWRFVNVWCMRQTYNQAKQVFCYLRIFNRAFGRIKALELIITFVRFSSLLFFFPFLLSRFVFGRRNSFVARDVCLEVGAACFVFHLIVYGSHDKFRTFILFYCSFMIKSNKLYKLQGKTECEEFVNHLFAWQETVYLFRKTNIDTHTPKNNDDDDDKTHQPLDNANRTVTEHQNGKFTTTCNSKRKMCVGFTCLILKGKLYVFAALT